MRFITFKFCLYLFAQSRFFHEKWWPFQFFKATNSNVFKKKCTRLCLLDKIDGHNLHYGVSESGQEALCMSTYQNMRYTCPYLMFKLFKFAATISYCLRLIVTCTAHYSDIIVAYHETINSCDIV